MNFGFGNASDNGGQTPTSVDVNKVDPTGAEPAPVNTDDDGNGGKTPPVDSPDNKQDIELNEGATVEVGEEVYTVDANGNLVDKDNKIFKQKSEVAEFLKGFDAVEENDVNTISVSGLQQTLGIELTDENNKPVSFEETPEGLASYVRGVINSSRNEVAEAAINSLYERYPIIEDVLNYYIANGNSLEGFATERDYSNIVIDDNNEAQQESIIREAWQSRNQPGVDNYIAYLKSQGILAATAKDELNALNAQVERNRQEMAEQAEAIERENQQRAYEYWNGVKNVIDNRNIAGYQIPETMVRVVNGQKVTVTPNDFFNYLYQVDDEGFSRYDRDLAAIAPETRMQNEILRAYLTFVGGDYSSLVSMAANNKEVQKLRYRAKENNAKTVRITNAKPNKSVNKETFGYY